LKDREKLPQKSPLDVQQRSSIHGYLEDHQGSIIGVFFLQLGSIQTPHHCSHTATLLIFALYPFSKFFIVINSLCLLLTNSLIAAKVEHNFGDSKAINKIFFHVHAGKHS
jgi:hypothetical protein